MRDGKKRGIVRDGEKERDSEKWRERGHAKCVRYHTTMMKVLLLFLLTPHPSWTMQVFDYFLFPSICPSVSLSFSVSLSVCIYLSFTPSLTLNCKHNFLTRTFWLQQQNSICMKCTHSPYNDKTTTLCLPFVSLTPTLSLSLPLSLSLSLSCLLAVLEVQLKRD